MQSMMASWKAREAPILDSAMAIDKDTLSAGSILLKGLTADEAKKITTQFSVDLKSTKSAITSKKAHKVNLPRVAIYHTWFNTQDEGWSRYTFEQRGIPFTSIDKDDLK